MNTSKNTVFGSLKVADELDEDTELEFDIYGENTYLPMKDVKRLRDHLHGILNNTTETAAIEGDNPIASALLEVAAAIRESAPKPISQVLDELISEGDQRLGGDSYRTPEPARELGRGKPQPDDDPEAWNVAALNRAKAENKRVSFVYEKPALFGRLNPERKPYDHVKPIGEVQHNGPSHDSYMSVLTRHYSAEAEYASYVVKTFRLDRIVGYVEVKD